MFGWIKKQNEKAKWKRTDKVTWICLKKIWTTPEEIEIKHICNTKFTSYYHHIDYVECPSCGTKGSYCCIELYSKRRHG